MRPILRRAKRRTSLAVVKIAVAVTQEEATGAHPLAATRTVPRQAHPPRREQLPRLRAADRHQRATDNIISKCRATRRHHTIQKSGGGNHAQPLLRTAT